MVFPKPEETAVLTINGMEYRDWETVMVRQCKKDTPYFHARFTCSEGIPLAKNWAAMRIIPGDLCTVELAGELAITGFVNTRQVFYDARRHHIEIQVSSYVMKLAQSSAITKTHEFKDIDIKKFAKALCDPAGVNFITKGKIPDTKFPRISIAPGTSILDAIEEPLRALGSVDLTSNAQGDLVAVGEDAENDYGDTVVEGGDDSVPRSCRILEGREILYSPGHAKNTYTLGQRPGDDQTSGAKAAHENYAKAASPDSMAPAYSPQAAALEIPAWDKALLQGRANAGRDWQREDQVTVFVTVQGWLKPSGGLWEVYEWVTVVSPMLVMDGGLKLETKSVTFTQDNQTGTRTVLELCNTRAMGGDIPQAPGTGQSRAGQ